MNRAAGGVHKTPRPAVGGTPLFFSKRGAGFVVLKLLRYDLRSNKSKKKLLKKKPSAPRTKNKKELLL